MTIVAEKAILAVTVVLIAVLILTAGVLGLGGVQLLNMPSTDFFGFMENMFKFIGDRIGLLDRNTGDFFCGKELKDAANLCAITDDQLAAYCKSTVVGTASVKSMPDIAKGSIVEVNAGACGKPVAGMVDFCKLAPSQKDWACEHQAEFKKGCTQIKLAAASSTMAQMPFCK